MAKNPMTSRERRGIAALAVVTLLITLAGFLHRSCVTATLPPPSTLPQTTVASDTASTSQPKDTHRNKKVRKNRKRKSNVKNATSQPRDILSDTIY